MQSDYYINLHFNQAVAQRTGYAFKIGDKGCTFHLHCEDLNPSGMFPHIVFNHPNNTCVEGVPTGSGRDYTYTIAGNEFGVCGKTVVDLKFYDNNNNATQRISTASFMIEIIPDTYTDFEEPSSSYADSLERAREEIDAAILDLQGAEHDLEEAETDLGNMSEQFADTLQDYIDAFGNTGPINPRGAYDPDTEYHPRDSVSYTAGGKTLTYINRQTCTGIAPTDPDEGAAHWQIMIDVSVGGSFSALSDVSVDPQTLADGQMPVYNGTDEVWENKTILENSLTSTATDKALTAAKGKELQDNKQDKELETPITVAGTSKTTVETALGAINAYVDNSVAALFDVYSAKNLAILNMPEIMAINTNGTWNGNVYSYRSVDFTVTKDGIAVSGTATGGASYIDVPTDLKNGNTYIASGITGGTDETYQIKFLNKALTVQSVADLYEGEREFKKDSSTQNVELYRIRVASGANVTTNIYPMVRDARVVDSTFVSYAKTNQQLTNDKVECKDLTTIFATGTTNNTGAQIAAGKFFYLNGVYCKAKTNIAANAAFTLNTNFEVASVGKEIERISATKRGTNTTITGYTDASNPYICPEDGYITINSAALTTGIIRLMILGSDNQTVASEYMNINGAYSVSSIYVRKGMKAYLADITTGAGAEYRSLV